MKSTMEERVLDPTFDKNVFKARTGGRVVAGATTITAHMTTKLVINECMNVFGRA